MSQNLNKVLWSEGILLGPQHFQQLDRYLDHKDNLLKNSFTPFQWGLINYEIDEVAIENGVFRLLNYTIIFKNGKLAQVNRLTGEPLTLSLNDYAQDNVDIYLCVLHNNKVSGISGYPKEKTVNAAWEARYFPVCDEYDSERYREVGVMQLNCFLQANRSIENKILDEQEQYEKIKIASLKLMSTMKYVPQSTYIPPVVHIKADKVLSNIIQQLNDLVNAKLQDLGERKQDLNLSDAHFGIQGFSIYILHSKLNQINQYLVNILSLGYMHPLDVFLELSQYLASISAFNRQILKNDIIYDHNDLYVVFSELQARFSKVFAEMLPEHSVVVQLHKNENDMYFADDIAYSSLQNTSFILSVAVQDPDPSWINNFIHENKIASRKNIEALITSSIPGVAIKHLIKPPSVLNVKVGHEYFLLQKNCEIWESIVNDRSICIHLSKKFAECTIKLIIIE